MNDRKGAAMQTQRRDSMVLRRTAGEQIGELLRCLTEEGGASNFVIFQVGECPYVQFLASCGSAVMYGEASSGHRRAIADQTVATLELFGWRGQVLEAKLHLDW